jgi:hypothetical protein
MAELNHWGELHCPWQALWAVANAANACLQNLSIKVFEDTDELF